MKPSDPRESLTPAGARLHGAEHATGQHRKRHFGCAALTFLFLGIVALLLIYFFA